MSDCIHESKILSVYVSIPSKTMQVGLWKTDWVNQNIKTLLPCLGADEKKIYQSYRLIKNKIQFLGGRILLKRMLYPIVSNISSVVNQFTKSLDICEIQILPDLNNRNVPVLQVGNQKINSIYFSISHKHDYIFVSLDTIYPIAVDVEKIDPRIIRVKERFLSQDESNLILYNNYNDPVIYYSLIWSANECMIKIFNQPMYKVINLTNISRIDWTKEHFITCITSSFISYPSIIFCHQWMIDTYVFSVISFFSSSD